MTFAHLSDTHLGYRAYSRTTSHGFNQREVDVMKTFRSCLEAIEARNPDVVVHSGDLFHVVRPSNATIHHTFKSISEFQARRKGKPFILIGGNHDTPRMAESGNILNLLGEIPGMIVHTGDAEAFEILELDLEVLCVPSQSLVRGEAVDYVPQFKRKYSLLTMHGLATEAIKQASNFEIAQTRAEKWTYVALGDFHMHQAYGDNICYAGATDFTSTNIWEESGKPKGWVWFDADSKRMEFVPVATRPVLDLPKIDARDMTPDALVASIRENAEWDVEAMPIVRQRVTNVHTDTRGRIGSGLVRDLNANCLNYLLRLLPPEVAGSDAEQPRTEAMTLEASWEQHIAKAEIAAGTDRAWVKELGLHLLKEVAERASDPAQA